MPDPPSRDRARRTVDDMDNRDEVRDFLTTRRERLTPEQAGVPFFGGKRRVKGLRREEVAMLAGMSTDYYTRLERGNLTGVSHPVLESLARALQLDEAERAHQFDREWATVAADSVAALRTEAGRNPYDRALTDLIGELSTRSEQFRTWWAAHNVKLHYTATKIMHHAIAGDLELTGEALHLPGDPGLTIITYTYEPASPTEQALAFLASWSTREPAANNSDQPTRPDPGR